MAKTHVKTLIGWEEDGLAWRNKTSDAIRRREPMASVVVVHVSKCRYEIGR